MDKWQQPSGHTTQSSFKPGVSKDSQSGPWGNHCSCSSCRMVFPTTSNLDHSSQLQEGTFAPQLRLKDFLKESGWYQNRSQKEFKSMNEVGICVQEIQIFTTDMPRKTRGTSRRPGRKSGKLFYPYNNRGCPDRHNFYHNVCIPYVQP